MDDSKQESDRPENIGWVTALDDREPTSHACPEAQEQGREERVDVLEDERQARCSWSVRRVLVEVYAVEPVVSRIAGCLRTDDCDAEAGGSQRLAFEPDPAVEGNRQILDENKYASSLARGPADARAFLVLSIRRRDLGALIAAHHQAK